MMRSSASAAAAPRWKASAASAPVGRPEKTAFSKHERIVGGNKVSDTIQVSAGIEHRAKDEVVPAAKASQRIVTRRLH